MTYAGIDELYCAIRKRLAESGYSKTYSNESDFENAVWDRLLKFKSDVKDPGIVCLTSHNGRKGRSADAWKVFCSKKRDGPDVNVLGCNNRLDIVIKHKHVRGSIGIEVKCLGVSGHAAKLTQGIGQVMVALAHRSLAILLIHCGTVTARERKRLREVAEEICKGTRMSVIVVP